QRTITLMKERKEDLTITAAREGGKPYKDSKVEVERAINGVKLAIEDLSYLGGSEIPMGHTASSLNRLAFTRREPIGVVASVSAFNHPLNLIVHQVIPAVVVGAPVIVKPAGTTPMSCLNFVRILYEAGLPERFCQAVVCDNEVAEKMVTDARVNFLSFIGSAKVGWMLRSKIAPGTRCALEHGGAAPAVVTQNANLSKNIPGLVKGGFYHSGQVCVSVQRIFVHHSVIDEFSKQFLKAVTQLKTGDQLSEETDCGPMITPGEADRVESWIKEAVEEGAKLLLGGGRISESLLEPTVLLNPSRDSKVSREEIFGPVVCIYSYDNASEAVEACNELPYAFQASVITDNLEEALYFTQEINATAVMVNDHTAFRVDWMPFGGRDTSGLGLGGIRYSMHDMTREKLIVIKSENL
ncbi:MAG: aldehyde dehydrogenase family protein, partial [Bacteroidota bacterium]